MGSPDRDVLGLTSILIIAGVIGLGFIVFYVNCRLNQPAWKRFWGSLERRGRIKPAETEEDQLENQHQTPMALKSLRSAIPAALKKLERAYKAPAHITANDPPDDWERSNRDSEASWDSTSVRSHHPVFLAHLEPSASSSTGAFNFVRTSWPSTGSSVPSLDSAITAFQGAVYHGRGSPFRSHDNNHAARNAVNHGQGTGTGVWLQVPDGDSALPSPLEAVPKAKEIFPVPSVPSQAVGISGFSPSPIPR